MEPIDFWNLAGRAGRLRFELSGNIFCVKENDKDWKKIELLNKQINIALKPSIENHIDLQLKKIEDFIRETPNIKVKTEKLREVLSYIANVICIDTLEIEKSNFRSTLITKLIAENKDEILNIVKQKHSKIELSTDVLRSNQSVKINIQNEIYLKIKNSANKSSFRLPSDISYENCKIWLKNIYNAFHFEAEEKKVFKSVKQIDYYAMLMNQWINGIALSSIINQSIQYYDENGKDIQIGFKPEEKELFDKTNKKHVNILIGNIIEDIEKVLRFTLEKYFNTYYTILVAAIGEEEAGPSWATFLEYGTRNSVIIALQNLGLSRHSANYLYTKYKSALNVRGDKLIGIDTKKLKKEINRDDIEFDEINSILL